MSLATAKTITVSPLDTVKMEERKRPALDDGAPPSKRQAVTVNGAHVHPDTDMPWKDDIERYQKDAILRQLREYKREKLALEQHIATITQKSEYHDHHLRTIDAWLLQLLDEVSLLSNSLPTLSSSDRLTFNTSLLSSDSNRFEEHLKHHSEEIKSNLTKLFAKFPCPSPDTKALQEQLASLLAAEKRHTTELQQALVEKEQLSERLENASYRYMVAEKKLDRAKSAQVAKLEAQAIQGSRSETVVPVNGENDKNESEAKKEEGLDSNVIEAARREATAVAEKRAEQLEKLSNEHSKLMNELTATQSRLVNLSDEDFANSDLFKALKSQHEEAVKRLNDLEATNIHLREELKSLQAERTSYREEADNEVRNATIEMESQLARTEADLARVRHRRDELVADFDIHKANVDEHKTSLKQMRDLVDAQKSRIAVLESETARLKQTSRETSVNEESELADLDLEQLRNKLHTVVNEKKLLDRELTSMESAWRKASNGANKKVQELIDAEDKISRSAAEKAKADQKYFAAMKLKETKENELRSLKAQNAKSSEIVSQLKEAEANCRSLLLKVEGQLGETKEAVESITNQYRSSQAVLAEQRQSAERSTCQINDLKKALTAKDASVNTATQAQRQAEVEVSQLKTQLEDTRKSLEAWKKKGIGNQNDEFEMLRTMALCGVCRSNFKDTVIKTCGHITCQRCIAKQLEMRSRKCPLCGKAFGQNDHMRVTL